MSQRCHKGITKVSQRCAPSHLPLVLRPLLQAQLLLLLLGCAHGPSHYAVGSAMCSQGSPGGGPGTHTCEDGGRGRVGGGARVGQASSISRDTVRQWQCHVLSPSTLVTSRKHFPWFDVLSIWNQLMAHITRLSQSVSAAGPLPGDQVHQVKTATDHCSALACMQHAMPVGRIG